MATYRRRPSRVEAICWDGRDETVAKIQAWAGSDFTTMERGETWEDDPKASAIMRCDDHNQSWVALYYGDYVLFDERCRLYVMRKAAFEDTFERVEE
jgi:hypothetical protein